jgi:hypothetical protein
MAVEMIGTSSSIARFTADPTPPDELSTCSSAEIKKVAKSDPRLASEGAVLLLERISPATGIVARVFDRATIRLSEKGEFGA